MQRLEVGKLYSCSGYFLLLFPDKEAAAAGLAATQEGRSSARAGGEPRALGAPDASTAYWTRELGKPVNYCNPETPLLVLTVEEKYVEILAGDKVGWAICQRWLDIKEITDAAA